MQEMPKTTNLYRRGSTFYFRIRIPKDLLDYYGGKREIQRSLKTSDYKTARQKVSIEKVHQEAEFQNYRSSKLSKSTKRSLSDFSEIEINSIVFRWFEDQDKLSAIDSLMFEERQDLSKDEAMDNLKDEVGFWQNELKDKQESPRYLEHLLNEQNITSDFKHYNYKYLLDLYVKMRLELATRSMQRFGGGTVKGTGDQSFYLNQTNATVQQTHGLKGKTSFGQLCDMYEKHRTEQMGLKERSLKQLREEIGFLKKFISADEKLTNIKREQCRKVFELLKKIPTNSTKLYPNKSIEDVIALGKLHGKKLLSPRRVNAYTARLSSIFKFGIDEELIDTNPSTNLQVSDPVNAQDKRLPFNQDQLKRIFEDPEYKNYTSLPPNMRGAKFWIPIIALYTGMRMEECCQIHASDIKDIGKVKAIEVKRSLKTKNSKRTIPIHPCLEKLGFLELVQDKKQKNEDHLFSDLHKNKLGIYSHAFSKWFNRHLDKLDLKDPKICFHSFRHNFRDALRQHNTPTHITRGICGWKGHGMEEVYGTPDNAETLYKYLKEVSYPINL